MEGSRTVGWLQQKEEGMIEDPLGAFGQRGWDYAVIRAAVNEELNRIA